MLIYKNEATAAKRRILFVFFDNTGSPLAGQTFTTAGSEVKVSIDGAAWAAAAADAVAIGNGAYYYEASQAETNHSTLAVKITKATFTDVFIEVTLADTAQVVPANVTQWLGVAPQQLGALGGMAIEGVRNGTAQAGGTNSITLDAGASATDGFYSRSRVTITGGTGASQSRLISHYVGSTKVVSTNRNWATAPDNTSVFTITADSNNLLSQGLAQGGAASSVTLKATESAVTDFYRGVWIHLTSGTGANQSRLCTAYNGTTKVATVDTAWATNPDNTTVYEIMTGADVSIGSSVVTTDVNVIKWLGVAPAQLGAIGGIPLITAVGQGPGGTLKPNSIIDSYVYSTGKPTSWRVRAFATKTACDAAVAGHADGTDSEIEREKYTATYNVDGTLASLKRDKEL